MIRDRLLLILLAVALWQVGSLAVGDYALPSPAATAAYLAAELVEGAFWLDVADTLLALAAASSISILGGVGIGTWLGVNRYAGLVAEPILTSVYSLPKITLYPLILLIFGIGFDAKVALGALHGIIPCALFTLSAIRAIPAIYPRAGMAMGLSRGEIARTILLPAVAPEVLTGIRIGVALTLLGTLIGELFASQSGLGHLLRSGMERADATAITALAVFLMALALTINAALARIGRFF